MTSVPSPGPSENPTPPPNLFDLIQERGLSIIEFHCVTHGITLTDDERDAIELGMSSGIHAAIELLVGAV